MGVVSIMKQDFSHLPYPSVGDSVRVIEKKNYGTDDLTEGVVKDLLTKKKGHPRGTKVRLTSGVVGRVQEFVGQEMKKEVLEKDSEEEVVFVCDDEEMLV